MKQPLRLLVVTCLVLASSAKAQKPDVPVDLVTALTATGGFGANGLPDIVVGTLPAGTSDKLRLPRSATVVGSAAQTGTTVIVVTYPAGGDSILKIFTRELVGAGWVDQYANAYAYGGFITPQMADSRRTLQNRMALCHKDGMTLAGTMLRQQPKETLLSLRLALVPATSYCAVAPTSTSGRPSLPSLSVAGNPADQNNIQSCYPGGGGMGSNGTSITVRTPKSPDDIADALVKQLSDSGWIMEMMLAPPVPSAMRTLTRKDSLGNDVKLTLTVAGIARDSLCRSMTMDVQSTPRRP